MLLHRCAVLRNEVQNAKCSSRLIRSQNLVSLQTLPTPWVSSRFRASSARWRTSRRHLAAIQLRRPSLRRSCSMALRRAASPGATYTGTIPGTHSRGSTDRSTRTSAEGRVARRRERRMDTSERVRRREMMVVGVRKICRAIRSSKEGRFREVRSGDKICRVCRRRYVCKMGARETLRRTWLTYISNQQVPTSDMINFWRG